VNYVLKLIEECKYMVQPPQPLPMESKKEYFQEQLKISGKERSK
jgi:hypothetical protein